MFPFYWKIIISIFRYIMRRFKLLNIEGIFINFKGIIFVHTRNRKDFKQIHKLAMDFFNVKPSIFFHF